MTIQFSCPNCFASLKAPDEYAGKMAKCKRCQSKMQVPTAENLELELEPDHSAQNHQPSQTRNLREELKKIGFPDLKNVDLNELPFEDIKSLFEWGITTFRLGSSEQGTIDEVKYDGHLVILSNGTRWEVGDGDTFTSEGWTAGDEVVIVNDRMYLLDELDSVAVRKG